MFGFNRQQSITDAVERDLQQIVKNDLPSHRDSIKSHIAHQNKWIASAEAKKRANAERIKKLEDEVRYLKGEIQVIDGHIEAARKAIAAMEQL